MEDNFEAVSLVENGDVVVADGATVEEIFSSVCDKAELPSGLDSSVLVPELLDREKVLSTAVGNGIAIPHPRRPLFSDENASRVIVAYLKTPIDMQAPDFRKVNVMFILLSASSQFHIKALSSLAKVFKNEEYKKGLQLKPVKAQLAELIKKCSK